jgi:hypothetical protein
LGAAYVIDPYEKAGDILGEDIKRGIRAITRKPPTPVITPTVTPSITPAPAQLLLQLLL